MWEGKNPPTDTRGFFEAVKFPLPQSSRVAQIKPPTRDQAPKGVRARCELHASGRHLEDVRTHEMPLFAGTGSIFERGCWSTGGTGSETARVHHAAQRRGCRVAARGARASARLGHGLLTVAQ